MALAPDGIMAMAREAGGYESPQYPENLVMDDHDLSRFARAVEAEVRKQDDALIRQMLGALWLNCSEQTDSIASRAIDAARARLEEETQHREIPVDGKRSRDMPSSNTVKVKTADLTDLALDWAVAKCEGHHWRIGDRYPQYAPGGTSCWMTWRVSSDWAQAGPIIEQEKIYLNCLRAGDHYRTEVWEAWPYASTKLVQQGVTPLIAAMRCYVASKLGDEVEIPKELA